jgi:PAS domain-containing protein
LALAGGLEAATRRWAGTVGGISNFDLEVRSRSGDRIWVDVSTIVFDNERTGRRLFVRLARDITQRRQKEEILDQMTSLARQIVSVSGDAADHAPVTHARRCGLID